MKEKNKKKTKLLSFGKKFPKLTKEETRKSPKRIEGGYLWAG